MSPAMHELLLATYALQSWPSFHQARHTVMISAAANVPRKCGSITEPISNGDRSRWLFPPAASPLMGCVCGARCHSSFLWVERRRTIWPTLFRRRPPLPLLPPPTEMAAAAAAASVPISSSAQRKREREGDRYRSSFFGELSSNSAFR